MKGNALSRCYRDFAGIETRDRDLMLSLQRDLLKTLPLQNSDAAEELESQITQILEKAMIHLQQTLLPETLDVIICCLHQSGKQYRAYLFNKNDTESDDLHDFDLSVKKDVILCKFTVFLTLQKCFQNHLNPCSTSQISQLVYSIYIKHRKRKT